MSLLQQTRQMGSCESTPPREESVKFKRSVRQNPALFCGVSKCSNYINIHVDVQTQQFEMALIQW